MPLQHRSCVSLSAGSYRLLGSEQDVSLHPSSVLSNKGASYVIFAELVWTTKPYARGVTIIDPQWLREAGFLNK